METQAELISSLYTATQSGRVPWQPSGGVGTYEIAYKKGSVKIQRRFTDPDDDEFDIIFFVYNAKGKLVDEFSDVDIAKQPIPDLGHNSWFGVCKTLFFRARRTAMKADNTISDLIAEIDATTDLDDDIPF